MLAKANLNEQPDLSKRGDVDAVRAFNRFYTQKIGILSDAPLKSGLSLTESRVLYELAHRDSPTASEIKRDLGLDQGYLSRILRRFEKQGFLKRTQSATDRRQSRIALTRSGRALFARIDRTWQQATGALIEPLAGARRQELVAAMGRIRALLGGNLDAPPFILRAPRVGDMGWIVHRQAVLYATDYGWTAEFEAMIAEIVAAFIRDFDPKRERCWIAERNGEIVGSVFLVKAGAKTGKLRLLNVEPSARGLGIGAALVDACIAEARRTGCEKLVLWTNDILVSARKIYEAAGFRLVGEEPHHSFGKDLVSQDWELELESVDEEHVGGDAGGEVDRLDAALHRRLAAVAASAQEVLPIAPRQRIELDGNRAVVVFVRS